jgi:hypothetical protein
MILDVFNSDHTVVDESYPYISINREFYGRINSPCAEVIAVCGGVLEFKLDSKLKLVFIFNIVSVTKFNL